MSVLDFESVSPLSASLLPAIAPKASGYRHNATGALAYVGDEGDVWSSSPTASGSQNATYLAFKDSWVNTFRSNNRSYGFSVRCVQHLPGSLSRFGGIGIRGGRGWVGARI